MTTQTRTLKSMNELHFIKNDYEIITVLRYTTPDKYRGSIVKIKKRSKHGRRSREHQASNEGRRP